jgi:hypothetical protein
VRCIVIGTIVLIVPFFMLLLFNALVLLTPVFNPAVCISSADDIMQISVVSVSYLVVFLQWSETASRVLVRTLPMVNLMTPRFIIMIEC